MNNKFNGKAKIASNINRSHVHPEYESIENEENNLEENNEEINNNLGVEEELLQKESIPEQENSIEEKAEKAIKLEKVIGFFAKNPWIWPVLGIAIFIFLLLLLISAITGGNDSNFDSACDFNLTKVELTNCYRYDSQKVVMEELDLKDYIMGVMYGEIGNSYKDAAKQVEMIAAKTFAFSRGGYDSETKKISIKNCVADQVYCDVKNGCYEVYEGFYAGIESYKWLTKVSYGYEGELAGVKYGTYKPALSEEKIEELGKVYDEIANYLWLDEDFTGPVTKLNSSNSVYYIDKTQHYWRDQAEAGKTYLEILEGMADSGVAKAESYAGKKLYDLATYCQRIGGGTLGNYTGNNFTIETGDAKFLTQSVKSYFAEKGLTLEAYNKTIYDSVISSGPGTRNAVVSAAASLVYYLYDSYKLRFPYTMHGGHGHYIEGYDKLVTTYYGIDPDWGTKLKGYDAGKYGIYYYYGMDCSAFVNWAIHNAGYKMGNHTSGTYKNIPGVKSYSSSAGDSSYHGQPGDLLAQDNVHVMLIVGVDETNRQYYVAHQNGRNNGLWIQKHSFDWSSYYLIDMSGFYNNPDNVVTDYSTIFFEKTLK